MTVSKVDAYLWTFSYLWLTLSHFRHPKLRPIPLGISNADRTHESYKKVIDLSRNLKPFHERKTLLYLMYYEWTNEPVRKAASKYFRQHFGNSSDVVIDTKESYYDVMSL